MLKPYERFPELNVSDDGKIYQANGKELPQTTNHHGYRAVSYYINKKNYVIIIHTAVARTFVDGYKPGLQVNHIDGNKENNNASNLEWVTGKQNMRHAVDQLNSNKGKRNGMAKPVTLTNPKTNIIEYKFDAIADAIRFLFPNSTQKQVYCKTTTVIKHIKTGKPCYGYIIKYA